MGKPVSDALGKDVPRTAQNLRFFADHARLSASEAYPTDTGHHAYARYEPAGVVAAIAPWNFPLMLESWKIAPALAWGNTVVLKPAEDSPASATILARLAVEAGLPPGVLNVLHGYGPDSAGAALTADPRVDRITFTGESSTGRVITAAAARNLTPVSLELGGKGANLVFADADLTTAVDWSIRAIFTNAGQVCLAGSRLYVQRPVLDEFLARFVAAADALVVGDPKDAGTQIGPLSSQTHHAKVTSYLEDPSGKVLTGGPGDGWFVRPTVVVDAAPDSPIQCEEIFGPVVTVTPFDTEDEAVAAANNTVYGLAAGVWSKDLGTAHRVGSKLRAGTVWLNTWHADDVTLPRGGYKQSGWGRELGSFGLDDYTELKTVIAELR
jgi:aminomuconate-semialdehyde/2-hydroxymuconate-6-semialdehyde dehydrogenase